MTTRGYLLMLVAAAGLAVSCEGRGSQPLSPSSPTASSALTAGGGIRSQPDAADHGKTIMLMDACDPDTFNAPPPLGIGPGTCSRHGGVSFDNFIDQLTKHQSVGAWHMAPGQATIKLGDVLAAFNHGGETHTFTEVKEYGGGFVPLLNTLSGNTTVAPECSNPQTVLMLKPGDSFHETTDEVGVEKYQCCIHPWMRAEIHIVQH